MALTRHLSACVALLLGATAAGAQENDGEWVSYRDAYRAMVVFDKYGKPKHLIQHHYQVMPKEKGVSLEGVRLALVGKTTQLNLPLDATGRAVFPLLKAAYDENAALMLNRKMYQFVFRQRVTLAVRPDGVYEAADLRAGCEQALGFERYISAAARGQKCVGVRFVFDRQGAEPTVRIRNGVTSPLPVEEGAAFAGDPNDTFRTVNYRFAGAPERGQVVTQEAPLAIAPLFGN